MASCSSCWRSWTSGRSAPVERCRDPPVEGFAGACSGLRQRASLLRDSLVYPICGMRVDTPEAAALVVMVFYGGLHAIYLLLAVATIVLSLAMRRGAYAKEIAYLGFATAALDVIGSYPWVIGPVLTFACELSFAGWFVAVGSQLFRVRANTV